MNEFKEFNNPLEKNYDIPKEFGSMDVKSNPYSKYLVDLIGILEDINEQDLLKNYGISLNEYYNPTLEVIQKVEEHLRNKGFTR